MSRIEVDINPAVLKWAREESGFEPIEIANKIEVPIDQYKIWETKGKGIPLGKLKTIASKYKRQLAVFFLPEVPERISKPKDFRNLASAQNKLSKKVLNVIRDVVYFRQLALELEGESYWKKRYSWLKEVERIKFQKESIGDWLREKLNISIEEQVKWKSDHEAFKNWRQAIENKLGILVFQFSMPLNEVQGFCFSDSFPYSIIVNSKHPYTARSFTLFHELAHIFKHQSGICLIDDVSEKQKEEFECNSFAGAFLIPQQKLVVTEDLTEMQMFANALKVSREVYLRRLKEADKITSKKFFKLLEKIKETYKIKTEVKKEGFAVKPEVLSRASRGETFYNLVLNALNQNRISYTQASSILDLRISKILNEA